MVAHMRKSVAAGALLVGAWAVSGASRAATEAAASHSEPIALGLGAVFHLLLGLGVVLALIVLSAWTYRRLARVPRGVSGALRVLGGLSMGARERVVLIQVGEEQLLLGVAPGRIQTLHVLGEPIQTVAPPGPGTPRDGGFAQRLAAAIGQRRGT